MSRNSICQMLHKNWNFDQTCSYILDELQLLTRETRLGIMDAIQTMDHILPLTRSKVHPFYCMGNVFDIMEKKL
jgi:HD-like signal output (HDOD) protein